MGSGSSKTPKSKPSTNSGNKRTESPDPGSEDASRNKPIHQSDKQDSVLGNDHPKEPEVPHKTPLDSELSPEEKSSKTSEETSGRNVESISSDSKSSADTDPKNGATPTDNSQQNDIARLEDGSLGEGGLEAIAAMMKSADPVECRDRCLKQLEEIRKIILKDDYGKSLELFNKLTQLAVSSIGIINARRSAVQSLLNDIRDKIITEDVDKMLYKVVMDILLVIDSPGLGSKVVLAFGKTLVQSTDILFAFTRIDPVFSERVCEASGLLEALTIVLLYHGIFNNNWNTEAGPGLCFNVFLLIYNCSLRYSNKKRLREMGYIWILKKIMGQGESLQAFMATIALAGILDEEESKFFQSQKEDIAGIMDFLEYSVAERNHVLWTAAELATACGRLAMNDVNKKLMVEAGILNGLQTLCERDDPEEQKEALSAIWALAFDDDNKVKMLQKTNLIETIAKLRESPEEGVRTEAINTLWTLRDKLKSSNNPEFKELGESLSVGHAAPSSSPTSDELETPGKHIMISYSWDNKNAVFKVQEELEKNGYRVWIDRNEMKGSIIDSIADGVENADVMLMCISQKYKISKYCRAEAEYAFTMDIRIIPLLMESDFKADGWLGLIKGTKKHFHFNDLDYFDSVFPSLIKEVGQAGKGTLKTKAETVVQSRTDVAIDQRKIHSHGDVVAKPVKDVGTWSKEDVKKWLENNDCYRDSLQNMNGRQLLLLKKIQKEAPDHFYSSLKNDLKLTDFEVLTNLIYALDAL